MNIYDFLPKYPNIIDSKDDLLNPYDTNFYESIFKKKEFYDEKLEKIEKLSEEKGVLMKHQKIIARFLSSHTMYDSLLLVHQMGSGKTCAAIAAIEQIKNENNNFKGALIFAKGNGILQNFIKELRDNCTAGQYKPNGLTAYENKKDKELTELEITIRTKKLTNNFYTTSTFETFAKKISKTNDADIINLYSNHVIVIDEVHNIRIQDIIENSINMYVQFKRFLHLVKNCKILLLSGTPMKSHFCLNKYDFLISLSIHIFLYEYLNFVVFLCILYFVYIFQYNRF